MLSHREARAFYDRLGSRQDWQWFYEDPAVHEMVGNAGFERASDVFELGCGTGRLAEALLEQRLPSDARYLAVDVSGTMSGLAARRLARFGSRAVVCRTDGSPRLPAASGRFDRFVSTYVLAISSPPRTSRRSSSRRGASFVPLEPRAWSASPAASRGRHARSSGSGRRSTGSTRLSSAVAVRSSSSVSSPLPSGAFDTSVTFRRSAYRPKSSSPKSFRSRGSAGARSVRP